MQVAASKKHAGLWIGLAIVTLAIFFMPEEEAEVAHHDVGECMLKDVMTTPTIQAFMVEASVVKPTELQIFNSLEDRCAALNHELLSLSKAETTPDHLSSAAALFEDLRSFDAQYDLAMSYQELAYSPHNLSDQNATTNPERQLAQTLLENSKSKRMAIRICFLQLVTSARRLDASLPLDGANENGALGCEEGILAGIEEKAVRELEREESPTALSCLGVHWSLLAISSTSPLFGSGPMAPRQQSSGWVRDYWGMQAPADMVHAEDLFLRSAQAHEVKSVRASAFSLIHAHRIKDHARALESYEQHRAAAKRYQLMAQFAQDGGSAPLSAYALSQLSLSLKMQGSDEEALDAAKAAVDLTMDPSAQFVLATVRLSSGLLTTEASMKEAERQLQAAEGQLPTEAMEAQRAKVHSEMLIWQEISDGTANKCLWMGDAAQFVICAMCKLIF